MTTLQNEILIKGKLEDIWNVLNTTEVLDQYDPKVKKTTSTSEAKSGVGAYRKVDMKDGKNWFEEKCTVSEPNEALTYELTDCSFPVHNLNHTYCFEQIGGQVKVKQVMKYQMKYCLLGKLMDSLIVKKP